MKKLLKSVFSPPSLRVDLIVICGVVLLLDSVVVRDVLLLAQGRTA